jgi:cellulose synthase/poly-beta-1,6-N-acetylglucosamine synthase-like glycosyltransferase
MVAGPPRRLTVKQASDVPFVSMPLALTFWLATALLGWVYVGYPLVLAAAARLRPVALRTSAPRPTLTVVIAAHNEADQIAERVANVLAQQSSGAHVAEVIVASDGSTDSTDAIVADMSRTEPRLHLLSLPRGGQTAAQHAALKGAIGEVLILTDAETRFEEACLARLSDAFRDPRVGCATGRLEWRDEQATATAANEGTYWRYERRIRELESRAGVLTAVTGALLAIRHSAYRPVPLTASMDHLLPLYVREQGGLVVYVADAIANDRPISGLREQFRNRSRTATRGIAANLSMIGRLNPIRHPGTATAIWSHKLLRWSTPWLAGLAAVSATGLAVMGDRLYALVPLVAVVGVAAGIAGDLIAKRGRRVPRPLALTRALLVVNLAFARAWLNVVVGRQIESWHRTEWQARG